MAMLTSEQLTRYERDGFLILPDFVSHAQCDALIQEADQLVDRFEPGEVMNLFSTRDQEKTMNEYFLESGDQIRFFFEPQAFNPKGQLLHSKDRSINKIGHALHDLNPLFARFSRQNSLKELCHSLKFEDPLLMQSMYIFKQPRIGGEVICHQDSTFLYTEPMSVVGFWFALQDATPTNGCLYALPGGHRSGLKRKFLKTDEGSVQFLELDRSPWPQQGFVPLEAKKGTLVLLHGLLPHLSGANLSDQSRHAYTLHIIEGKTHYPAENWLQRRSEMPALGF